MSAIHYNDNPTPVGNPVNLNGRETSYSLGLYDGGTHDDQYADEPEQDVTFESPEGAAEWLAAVTAVLTPYINEGDRSSRVPNGEGWARVAADQEIDR